jgi:hypothetical protein
MFISKAQELFFVVPFVAFCEIAVIDTELSFPENPILYR